MCDAAGGRPVCLNVTVREPREKKEGKNVQVDKWTVSVETHPGRPDLPRQKIKLEIANIPAYTREVVPLRMNYSVLDGVSPTLVVAESIHEILADKLVALPTSLARIEADGIADTPARIRYRDIWDIAWLTGQGAEVDLEMLQKKVADYGIHEFPRLLDHAISHVPEIAASHAFRQQMSRFVERSKHEKIFGMPGYEDYFTQSVNALLDSALRGVPSEFGKNRTLVR